MVMGETRGEEPAREARLVKTPGASYQGRTSDFHISFAHTTWYEFPSHFAHNAMSTQGRRFTAWSDESEGGA